MEYALEAEEEHPHHHHHVHHEHREIRKVKSGGNWAYSDIGYGTWACLLCFFVGSALFITFFVFSGLAFSQSHENSEHMHSLSTEFHQSRQHVVDPLPKSKMVSVSTLSKAGMPKMLGLCALESYYSKSQSGGEPLNLLNLTIDEMRESAEMREQYYYHIGARLNLFFGLRVQKKHKANQPQPPKPKRGFLVIQFNVTSSFSHFSSVVLQELEFKTMEQSLGPLRNIVLCSNNPQIEANQRCDASLSKRGILTLHGQEIVPLVIPVGSDEKLKEQAVYDVDNQPPEREGEEEEDEDEIEEEEGGEGNEHPLERLHREKQKEEVIGLRMYNLVFYQSTTTTIMTKKNTSLSSPPRSPSAELFKERKVLTIEPNQCQ